MRIEELLIWKVSERCEDFSSSQQSLRILLLQQEVLVLDLASSYVQPHLGASGGLLSLWCSVAIEHGQRIDSEHQGSSFNLR